MSLHRHRGIVGEVVGSKEYRLHTTAVSDQPFGGIFRFNLGVVTIGDRRLDAGNLIIDKPARQVHYVDSLVDHQRAAFLIPGAMPVTAAVIFSRFGPGQDDPLPDYLPQAATRQGFFDRHRSGIIAVLADHPQGDVVAFSRFEHSIGLLHVDGHRLFSEHMFASIHGVNRHGRMQVMRSQNMDDIDIVALQQIMVIAVAVTTKQLRSGLQGGRPL